MRFSRRGTLIVTSVVTLLLTGWTAIHDTSGDGDRVGASVVGRAPDARAGSNAPVSEPMIRSESANDDSSRDNLLEATADPFRLVSFLPPPPQVVAPTPTPPPPPPKPVAPTFPYRYIGRMVGVDGKLANYLASDNELVRIDTGTILSNGFRVDSIGEKEVVITYMPLNEQTIIATQSAAR